MNKLRRNDLCNCGSGLKYKKCCMKNDYLTESVDECLFRTKLEFKYPQRQQIWMNSYKDLSTELVSQIDKVLSEHTLYRGGCYQNSHIISLMIDEVDVVQGWINNDTKGLKNRGVFEMGVLVQNGEIIELKKNHLIGKNLNGISHYYNGDTDEYWFRHSWNKYKNTHFDLTMELLHETEVWKSNVKKSEEWRQYFEVKTYDTSVLNNHSVRKNIFMNLIRMNNEKHYDRLGEKVKLNSN